MSNEKSNEPIHTNLHIKWGFYLGAAVFSDVTIFLRQHQPKVKPGKRRAF
jgi:hypothetical protein